MTRTEKNRLRAAAILPILAAGLLVISTATVQAQVSCLYADVVYDEGTCLYTACADPQEGQKCTWAGWSSCLWCDEPGTNGQNQ